MSLDYLDQSVYPDLEEPPAALESLQERADYVHRVCAAWDYGVHPEPETFALFTDWKEVFDRFPALHSPGYHAFRGWFSWDPFPVPPGFLMPTPRWIHLDRLEGREEDPCERMI